MCSRSPETARPEFTFDPQRLKYRPSPSTRGMRTLRVTARGISVGDDWAWAPRDYRR